MEAYPAFFGRSPVPGFIHRDDRIVYVNAAAVKLFGAESPEQLLDRSLFDLVDPAFHEAVRERIRFLVETGRPLAPLEESWRRLDDSIVRVIATAWLVPYREGQAMHVGFWDLSAQQEAERRLQASLDLIDSIVEGAPDPIFVKDLQGRFVIANSASRRALGAGSRNIIGMCDYDFLPGSVADALVTVDQQVTSTGITEVVEEIIKQEAGAAKTYLSTKSAWRDPQGKIMGLVGVARDISRRKAAERELSWSRGRLQLALEAGQMGMWDYDSRSQTLTWSEHHFRLFGLQPNSCEPTSELFISRIQAQDRAYVEDSITSSMNSLQDFSVQYRVVWPDETEHWLEARGQVSHESGTAIGTIGVVTDVTDRKRTENRLREAAKLESLGILAGGIAHDFNNLLTGILGNASLIQDSVPVDSDVAGFARSVVDASERATSLTRQMLAYSGRGHFVVEPVDLSDEVGAITALLKASIPKNVKLHLSRERGLPQIEADRGQLQQVVMNLVLNAAEAGGGNVYLRTLLRGEHVVLEVQDDGCGMPQEIREKIFDPFFTTKFTGRGLGLAAVQGIIRGHKGLIEVTSSPGNGTTFTVLIPASLAMVPEPELPVSALPRGGGELVLIVDDEDMVRDVAVAALRRRGYRTMTATNGAEAVVILRETADDVALVLLDITMPVMGGAEALKQLRSLGKATLFIASSGYPETEALTEFGAQIQAYIQKPYTASSLGRLVDDVIRTERHRP